MLQVADFPAAVCSFKSFLSDADDLQFRITMAAIDPSASPEFAGSAIDTDKPRATLKLIRMPMGDDDDEDDDDEDLQALLNGDMEDDEDDDDDEDEDVNGGPSDPAKSKKSRIEATAQALKEALSESTDKAELTNGTHKGKGKAVAISDDMDMDGEDDDDDDEDEAEEFVLCTLDPNQVSTQLTLSFHMSHEAKTNHTALSATSRHHRW